MISLNNERFIPTIIAVDSICTDVSPSLNYLYSIVVTCLNPNPEDAKSYIENYHKHLPPAESPEVFEDRNRLYGCKFNMGFSGGHPGAAIRKRFLDTDDRLINDGQDC